ncbi:CPBP family intramembrane glutamic endopeptidase [Novosphingobium bradum]|uniref:CPBP family intramembrane glutamic endopeptidase n=1 Tax=Novosphingobium bradum TaxID=1737444 RepID=A0ABV7IWJ4_9SPHN
MAVAMRAESAVPFAAGLPPAVRGGLLLVGGVLLAGAVVMVAPLGFNLLLAVPRIAAIDAAWLEGLFVTSVFGLLALVAMLGLHLAGRRAGWGARPAMAAPAGLACGVAGVAAALLLCRIAGTLVPGSAAGIGLGALLGGSLALLAQTGAEEYFFRGWLQPGVIAGWGRWPGLAASALGFAVVHFVSAAGAPLALLNLALAGLWLGILAERSGGLALPIAAHFGWNWAEELLLGAYPNPGVGNFGAVLDFDLASNPLWGGSGEALNASLAAAFALAALIAASLAWPDGRAPARR